jgi:hypothetical protein
LHRWPLMDLFFFAVVRMADFQTHWGVAIHQPMLQDRPHPVHHDSTVAILHVHICVPLARSALQRCHSPGCNSPRLVQGHIVCHPRRTFLSCANKVMSVDVFHSC